MAVKFLLMVVVLAATMDVILSKPHAVQLENTEESDDGCPCKRMSSFSEVEKRVFRRSPSECWRWLLFKKKCNRRCTTSAATKSPKPVPAATRPMKVREEDTKKRIPSSETISVKNLPRKGTNENTEKSTTPRTAESVEEKSEDNYSGNDSVENTEKSTISSTPNNPQTGNRQDSDANTIGSSDRVPVPQTGNQDQEEPQGNDPNTVPPSQPPLPTESTPSPTGNPKNDSIPERVKPITSTSSSTPYYSGKAWGIEPNAETIPSKPTVEFAGREDMEEDEQTITEPDNEESEENGKKESLVELNDPNFDVSKIN